MTSAIMNDAMDVAPPIRGTSAGSPRRFVGGSGAVLVPTDIQGRWVELANEGDRVDYAFVIVPSGGTPAAMTFDQAAGFGSPNAPGFPLASGAARQFRLPVVDVTQDLYLQFVAASGDSGNLSLHVAQGNNAY